MGIVESSDAKGGVVIGRITGVVLTLTVVTGVVGCADGSGEVRSEGSSSESSGDERLASGPFQLIEREDVYLNGVENEGRPPISFLLVGSDPSDATASEGDLVAAYADAMRRDGWRLDPYSTDEDWWVFYGGKDSGASSPRTPPGET